MKPYLKIVGALAVVGICTFGFFSYRAWKNEQVGDVITLWGRLEPKHFFEAKDFLMQSTAERKIVRVTNSEGGNWETHLALGTLIHDYGWDVEVVDLCASSCAIFIFPAGKKKYLHPEALLLFHGGPHQENLMEQLTDIANGVPADAHPERINKEGRFSLDPEAAPERKKIREFLGIEDGPTDAETVTRLIEASDRFYEHLGINILLPHFGQIGRYEDTYKSYKYGGFMYRLDSLEKFGIRDIEVKDGGEWRPERNAAYPQVYEVEYP